MTRPLTPDEARLLESAFRDNAAMVARWCARSFRDPALAEDAVQEAFLQLARRVLRGDTTTVADDPAGAVQRNTRWAAGRLLATRRASRVKEQRALDATVVAAAGDPDWQRSEARLVLESILDRLGHEQRTLLMERLADDSADVVAARRQGLTVKAYRRRRDRALLAARRVAEQIGMASLPAVLWAPRGLAGLRRRLRPLGDGPLGAVAVAVLAGAVVSTSGMATPPHASPLPGGRAETPYGAGGVALDGAVAAGRTQASGGNERSLAGAARRLSAGPAPATSQTAPPLPVVGAAQETPEDASIASVQSGGGGGEGTVVALGYGWTCHCPVVFRSRDGGATWESAPGPATGGDQLLLSPTYPTDPRLFVASSATTGTPSWVAAEFGRPFTPLPVPPGLLALTSAFGRGDAHLFVSALRGVWSYDTVSQALQPVALPLDLSVGVQPAGVAAPGADGAELLALLPRPRDLATAPAGVASGGTAVNEPSEAVVACATVQSCETVGDVLLPAGGWLAAAPDYAHDHLVLAGWSDTLYRSGDGGRHFTRATLPPHAAPVGTLAFQSTPAGTVLWSTMLVSDGGGLLARSDDLGATWHAVMVRASSPPNAGPAILAGGRLVVPLMGRGLACSADGGAAWSARCPGPAG